MRCACVDIGSNTTRLLVADVDGGRLVEVLSQRAFTRLGRALTGGAAVPEAKLAEVCEVVAAQVHAAQALGADRLRVVATAAVRNAGNPGALCGAIGEAAGRPVDVLSGEEEARLAFLGATATLKRPPDGPVAVLDVGGGSSELAVGTVRGGVEWWASVPVGSGVLALAHLHSDPPEPGEMRAARAAAAEAFAGVDPPRVDLALAVGGSATSLRRLVGPVLAEDTLGDGLEAICDAPSLEIADRLGLDEERVRLLPAGMLVLAEASRALGGPLEIALGGLREGVVLEADRDGR